MYNRHVGVYIEKSRRTRPCARLVFSVFYRNYLSRRPRLLLAACGTSGFTCSGFTGPVTEHRLVELLLCASIEPLMCYTAVVRGFQFLMSGVLYVPARNYRSRHYPSSIEETHRPVV